MNPNNFETKNLNMENDLKQMTDAQKASDPIKFDEHVDKVGHSIKTEMNEETKAVQESNKGNSTDQLGSQSIR
ncbi:hypothetical protein I4U23_010632 [Adineta vaga]|nr:hypothetical protein I4U23_010632 [Adineta vaga]